MLTTFILFIIALLFLLNLVVVHSQDQNSQNQSQNQSQDQNNQSQSQSQNNQNKPSNKDDHHHDDHDDDNDDDFKVYKKCKETWSNDKLWCDADLSKNYTLCESDSLQGPNKFDGDHVTLIATYLFNVKYLNTRNKYCNCGKECNPRHINTCLTIYTFNREKDLNKFWSEFKMGEYKEDINIKDLRRSIDDGFILFYKLKDEKDVKMIYRVKHEKVYSFDANGNTQKNDLRYMDHNVERYDGWFPHDSRRVS